MADTIKEITTEIIHNNWGLISEKDLADLIDKEYQAIIAKAKEETAEEIVDRLETWRSSDLGGKNERTTITTERIEALKAEWGIK